MNAKTERQVLPGPCAVSDEIVRPLDDLFIAVAREVPHDHLVAFFDVLAVQLSVLQRGAAHVRQRRLPADDFRHGAVQELGFGAQFGQFFGVAVHRQHAAGHRVARGVVAADDEQNQVAQIFLGRHVSGDGGVRQHGDQVSRRWRIDTLVPQLGEIGQAFVQLGAAGVQRGHKAALAYRAGRHVRPPGQKLAVFQREIKQRGQHQGGQLNRDTVYPIERLVAWQAIEHLGGAFADGGLHQCEVARRHDGANGFALRIMYRRVHRNETRQALLHGLVKNGDATLGPV